jgi:hypothetical protein
VGSLWVATNQYLDVFTACVHISEKLNAKLEGSKPPDVERLNTASFSAAINKYYIKVMFKAISPMTRGKRALYSLRMLRLNHNTGFQVSHDTCSSYRRRQESFK